MKNTVTLETVNKYNQIIDATIGTEALYLVGLFQEWKGDDKKWHRETCISRISTYFAEKYGGCEFYTKTVNGSAYLYMDIEGEIADRYCLDGNDLARKMFGV